MQQKFLILFFLAFILSPKAQEFQRLYDFDDFANEGGSILDFNNNFFTTHSGIDLTNGKFTVLLASFNNVGELLWDTSLTNSQKEFSVAGPYINAVNTLNENEKWVLGNCNNSLNDTRTPFLLKFTPPNDVVQITLFDTLYQVIPNLSNPGVYSGVYANEGVYLIGQFVSNSLKFFTIIKSNSNGQYMWHRSFLTSWTITPQCIMDSGNGLIVGAKKNDPSNSGESLRYISKFDYNGNLIWTNQYFVAEQPSLGVVSLSKLANGNYLFASNKYCNYPTTSIQPLIGELDATTGDTLWTRLYFDPYLGYDPNNLVNYNSQNRLHGFKKLESGGYIGVGECRHDIMPDSAMGPLDNAAFIMKLDENFNLLWKRIYVPEGYDELDMSAAVCRLNDFVENADGSITALGMVYMYTGTGPQGGYIQDSYMIRVDSLGCLIPGCSIGVTEFEDLVDLLVYPNPTSSNLTIQLPTNDNWTVRLYNMNGQLVSTEKINGNNRLDLNLQNFTSGLYTVQAMNENGKVYTEVVVKE
jgi:hypothetical protein